MTLTPIEFHRLAQAAEQEMEDRRRPARFRRWYRIVAMVGVLVTAAVLLHVPRTKPDWPTTTIDGRGLFTWVPAPEETSRRVEHLDDLVLTEHDGRAELGWPTPWLEYYRTIWTATRAGQSVAVESVEVLDRIKEYRRNQDEYWHRYGEKVWLLPFHVAKIFTERDFSTFPGTHSWEVRWKGLYLIVLVSASVWFSPLVLVFLRRAVTHWSDLRRSASAHLAGHCTYCDYDLRGSLEARRCPECGTPFSLEVIDLVWPVPSP